MREDQSAQIGKKVQVPCPLVALNSKLTPTASLALNQDRGETTCEFEVESNWAQYEDSELDDEADSHSENSACLSLADSGPLTDEGTHGGSDCESEDPDDSHIVVFKATP